MTIVHGFLILRQVSITPEITSRIVSRAVMEELVKLHKVSYLGGRLPAYDGRKSMYTAGPLPFVSKEFHINLLDEDDGSGLERYGLLGFSHRQHSFYGCRSKHSVCFSPFLTVISMI